MSEAQPSQNEIAAEQRIAAMQSRESNAKTVNTIASTGHAMSTVAGGAVMVNGAVTAFGAGGAGAVACYAAPIAAGMAGVWAGAKLANHLALDEKILNLMGKPRLAEPGPQPATVDHGIAHNHAFGGALGGLLAGIVAGAAVAALAIAVVGTGGLAAPLIIAAAAGFGGSLVGAIVNGIGSKMASRSGQIKTGSPDVFFERKPVARVTDTVACDRHSPPPQIAEGSETISVNGLPLARIGHKISCSAVIQEGCKTIFADNTTGQYGPIDAEMSAFEQAIVSVAEVGLSVGAIRFRSSKLGKRIFGEPIDPSDGSYVDFRTDFEYPGILPLALTRVYSGKERVESLLGSKWICNWSQRLLYDREKPAVILEDGEGEILQFQITETRLNARHLKAPHYHLTGTREMARLFDSRTQQTLVFATNEHDTHTGILTAIEDRNGNRIDFTYHERHLQRVIHSDGATFSVKTTPAGHIEAVTRDGEADPVVQYSYDPAGEITDVQSRFNGEFHFAYTKEGWLNHWHDSGATRVGIDYDGEGRVIATRTPEGLYNDTFIYFPAEHKTQYIDATGACSTFWFIASDLMARELDPLGNTTIHEYDGLDRRLSTTDTLGRVTRFDYDTLGLMTGETDWAGRTTGYQYDEYGQLTNMELPDGRVSAWEYDERGNLISLTEPDGTSLHFSYDGHGRLLSETAPDGAVSRWLYTGRGRLAAAIDPLDNQTSFDEDPWGRLTAVTNAAGHTTRYHYEAGPDNPRCDLSRIIHPDGGEERFEYDGEGMPASHVCGEGQTTGYRHGAFDLLRTVIDAKGFVTSLEYDGAARLTGVINAAGQRWSYGYDPAGRLAMETDWAGRQTWYERDAIGRVLTKRLPDGIEQQLAWDNRDRIVSVDTARQRIVYEYDDADRLIRAATYDGGNKEPESDLLFGYDDKGRLVKESQNGVAIEYGYDASGRLASRKSPSGETSISYDALGLPTAYASNGTGLSFMRNGLGLETERQVVAGQPERRDAFTLIQSYDPCGRLASQTAGPGGSPHSSPGHVSRRYRWDKAGRLVGVKDSKRGSGVYSYDPRDQINRITRRSGPGRQAVEHYGYDALMNLEQSNGLHHGYKDGAVRRIGQSSCRYDERGRVIEKRVDKSGFRPRTWRYLWDDFDRMTETHTPDGAVWRYTYDAFGRRLKKECVTSGEFGRKGNVTYLWQGATLAEECRSTGQTTETTRWHFEPGTFNPIAKETVSDKNGNSFYPIVTDHLGTPKEIFDTDGECLWQADHTLWGRMSVVWQRMRKQENGSGGESSADSPWPAVDCSLRFQNQWEDEESGLYYNLNRYYDPDSGQYLSQDPIGLEGGLRTHGYVHDPMQWIDPWGLAGCPKKKAIVVGEGMGRIKNAVKDLRSKGINARKYQTWGKNWPNGRRLTPSEETAALARNKRWIETKIKQGYDIYDIGPDGRPIPSKFYGVEQAAIKAHNYPTIKLPGY